MALPRFFFFFPVDNVFVFPNHKDVSFGGVYVPCIYRRPDGVIVGDSGLCCCMPVVQCVKSIFFERNYFPLFDVSIPPAVRPTL